MVKTIGSILEAGQMTRGGNVDLTAVLADEAALSSERESQ